MYITIKGGIKVRSNNLIHYRDLLEDLEMAIMSDTATDREHNMFLGLQGWYFNNVRKTNMKEER